MNGMSVGFINGMSTLLRDAFPRRRIIPFPARSTSTDLPVLAPQVEIVAYARDYVLSGLLRFRASA